jgi:hypothetical protein
MVKKKLIFELTGQQNPVMGIPRTATLTTIGLVLCILAVNQGRYHGDR